MQSQYYACSLALGGQAPPRLPLWLDLPPQKAPLPLMLYLPHYWEYWAILCTDVLSMQSEYSGHMAWTCLHVASSVWQILMHLFRVRLDPFEITLLVCFGTIEACYDGISDQPVLAVSHTVEIT